ncbi:hypothetical protein BSKO_01668 [Bryopsis sp. KO-2023]|nr:hypothetical protein BSKO_01668 [Bryopsis sp. KO-2023]
MPGLLRKRPFIPGAATSSFPRCVRQLTGASTTSEGASTRPPPKVSPEVEGGSAQRLAAAGFSLAGLAGIFWGLSQGKSPESMSFTNWSDTHDVTAKAFFQPESMAELEHVISKCHQSKQKVRVVGSALSPNGIAFNSEGMLSMALLDDIISIDKEKMQVRVQCGARVQEVVEALRPHGLTLQNYASIREQQIGGFMQVGAHGTGAAIPPVDEQVISMKLVTPSKGPTELSKHDSDPSLFNLVRVGLGCFGVVSEATLQCVPAHKLLEKTFVSTVKEVKKRHTKWLKDNQHLRYMWIPHTDSVVVVQCNPIKEGFTPPPTTSPETAKLATLPAINLLKEVAKDGKIGSHPLSEVEEMTFFEMRDVLLGLDPLDVEWVKKVNKVEAEFWKRSEGYRVGWSDEILGFDCGGQQWVLEVAMPAGTVSRPSHAGLNYMDELREEIESNGIPAHSPIEQRWTSSSASALSPAASRKPDDLHSWIGIIMYLATEDPIERQAITDRFMSYAKMTEKKLMPKYGATWHWAKLEVPEDPSERKQVQEMIRKRFPVKEVQRWRGILDPHNILGNHIVDMAFGDNVEG